MASSIQSIVRAVKTLECFRPEEPRLSLQDLAARLGWGKSTVHRVVNTLVQSGVVIKDPNSRQYALGYKLVWLARAVALHRDLQLVALPIMRGLRDVTGETVTLSVVSGRDRVVIQQVESPHEIRSVEAVGLGAPLHCGASGRLLLAYLPGPELEAFLAVPLQRYTRLTLTNPRRLRDELVRIRRQGYAVSYGEYSPRVCAMAAPIRTAEGEVIACMAALGPRDRVPDSRLGALRSLLVDAARRVGDGLFDRHRSPVNLRRQQSVR
jgi:DNA-binding IclR family transcriptional regulator